MADISEEYTSNYGEVNGGEISEEDKMLFTEYAENLKAQEPAPEIQPGDPQQVPGEEYSEEEESLGIWNDLYEGAKETPKQLFGGAVDAVDEALEAIDDVWDWGANNLDVLEGLHNAMPDIPSIPDNMKVDGAKTVTGGIVRAGSQFLVGFIPALKGAKAIGIGAKMAPYVAGATADMMVFDPMESRISNLIEEIPALQNPITQFLATDPENDSAVTGRLKNALEGAAMGGLTDGLMKAFKGYKGFKTSGLGDDAVKAAKKAQDTHVDEAHSQASKVRGVDPGEQRMSSLTKDAELNIKPTDEEVKSFKEAVVRGDDIDIQESLGHNLEYVDGPDSIKKSIQMIEKHVGDTMASARNKPSTWDSALNGVKKLAEEIGATTAQLKKTWGETANLDVKVLSARMLLRSSTKKLNQLMDTFLTSQTVDNAYAFERYIRIHSGVQAEVGGISSQIGRALNIHKKMATDMISPEELELMLDSVGGMGTIAEKAKRLKGIGTTAGKNKFIRNAWGAKGQDAAFYYWINSILSGPQTQSVNIISNSVASFADLGETFLAGGANAIKGSGDVTLREAGYKAIGQLHGVYDALKISSDIMKMGGKKLLKRDYKGFKTLIRDPDNGVGTMWKAGILDEAQLDPLTKFEHAVPGISGQAFGLKGKSGKMADFLGSAIGVPGRALMTFDELFKAINFRGELYALTARDGIGEGLSKGDLRAYIKKYAHNPKKSQWDQAIGKARELTFQEELGKSGKALQHYVGQVPALKWFMPFIRTPINLLKYVGRRTPIIHRKSSKMMSDLKAGGARAELAKSKLAMGSSLYAMGALLAANGVISGKANKDQWKQNQWINKQEVSLTFGGKQYSFSRMDPFGMFFGLCADIVELGPQISEGDIGTLASSLITIVAENSISKTYLRGISDVLIALNEPEQKMEKYVHNFTSGFIPNFLAQQVKMGTFHTQDLERKEIHSLRDRIFSRIPGFSEGIHPKRNRISGDPMMYGEGLAGGMLPFYKAEEDKDPVMQKAYEIGYAPKDLPKSLGENVHLSPKQYDDYQKLTTSLKLNGLTLHEALQESLKSKRFQGLPLGHAGENDSQKKWFSTLVNIYSKEGKIALLENNPELFALYKIAKGVQ